MAETPASNDSHTLRQITNSTPMDYIRARQDDSWVELASQPSSSSLSSINDEPSPLPRLPVRLRQRRGLHPLNHHEETSSQEEYEESESESDRVMTSSGEGPAIPLPIPTRAQNEDDDDDGNRTAINYPTRRQAETAFTPQPNAFSHPPSAGQLRHGSVPGSYFPATSRPVTRHSYSHEQTIRPRHLPQNILSPSYNAAAQHEEALRASLTTLLSCAAAARGLTGPDKKSPRLVGNPPTRTNRIEPSSFRLVPESALPAAASPTQPPEPTFAPTLRRHTSTSTSESSERAQENKRKAVLPSTRSSSRERRLKKARRSSSIPSDEVTPTLMTWVVSAGVVVFLSALSFTAGYSIGREAGRLEEAAASGSGLSAGLTSPDESLRTCARQASTGLGLKRTLARTAVQV